jgi:hypothetical protein
MALFVNNDSKLRHLSLQGMHLSLAIEEESALVRRGGASLDQDESKGSKKGKKEDKKAAKPKKEKAKPKENPAELKKQDEEEMPENAFESLIEVLAESHSL